jgi:putative glutamine amidotransferase
MTVRIAISGVRRQWDGAERQGVNAGYVKSVVAAGAIPIILPPAIGAPYAAYALEGTDALLLSGGEDVDPDWYDRPASPRLGEVDRDRDLFELALFAAARQRGMPILGICRGLQLINVALGGTLWQDLPTDRPSSVDHDAKQARTARVHDVRIERDSRTAIALGEQSMQVNSFHHQGIDQLAPALRASAWAADDLVEAVESVDSESWVMAVQWHPEEMFGEPRSGDQALFRALAAAAAPAY